MTVITRRQFIAAGTALACGSLWLVPRGAAASPTWIDQRQFGPFICQATFPLDDQYAVFADLPELEQELVRVLGIQTPKQPIYIHLLSTRSEHLDYVAAHHPAVPYRRALFVQSNGQEHVIAYLHDELDVDVRHECTHALLHSDLPIVPLWLDEGLAEYFEVPYEQRAFDHPHFDALRWNLRLGMMRTATALEERTDLSQMSGIDYRFSWAWVHFMLHGPQPAFDALVHYLADVRQGRPAGSLARRLEQAVPDPSDRMVQHFKHWRR